MDDNKYISYDTLLAAKSGNIEAIENILYHFHGYMVKRSLRTAYREDGSFYQYIDRDVWHHLETELIAGIYKFEIR